MVIERMTAKKVPISELVFGEWVKMEGMDPSYILTRGGEKISRARLLGTVVSRFVSEDQNFASITLDDSTETIRAKTFKTTKPVGNLEIGNIVDLIGKVREYNGEVYVIPESVFRVTDPNLEVLRKLELLGYLKSQPQSPAAGAKEKDEKEDVRKSVLKEIEASPAGIDYRVLLEKVKAKESLVEKVIDDILSEGICYEPVPGKIKKI